MRMFLLKRMEQLKQNVLSRSVFKMLSIGMISVVTLPAYAVAPMSDAELDSKFIEVQIRQICTLEKKSVDTKKSAYITEDEKPAKYTCRADDLFVTAIKNDGSENSKKLSATSDQSADSSDANPLLAGIIQNLRSLGGSDMLGVPVGVANSGNPIMFGSERYSYKWAGNLGDIFRPIFSGGLSGGVMAPYSIYDSSSLGYGFREEVHIPYDLPQPKIQSISINSQ